MNPVRWINDKTLSLSAFLTAAVLSSPAFGEDFNFNTFKDFAEQGTDTAYSVTKAIAKKVTAVFLLGGALVIIALVLSHLISSYNRKREMGQSSPMVAAGYVLGGILVIALTFIAVYFAYAGAAKIIDRF